VASGLNEEYNGVDAVVHDVHTVHLVFLVKVGVESLLNVLNNGIPGLVIVDVVTEARSINDSQPQTHTVLLDVCADRLNGYGLGNIETRGLALLGRVEGRVEEGVHQRRLSEARLT
jgi:hypothetical protein